MLKKEKNNIDYLPGIRLSSFSRKNVINISSKKNLFFVGGDSNKNQKKSNFFFINNLSNAINRYFYF